MIGFNSSATSYAPLSQEEVKLAKAFKLHTKMQDKMQQLKEHHNVTTAYNLFQRAQECDETRDTLREITQARRDNRELFTPEFFYALHGIRIYRVCVDSWEAESNARRGGFNAHLPQQEFSVDTLRNAINLGMGSRIPLGRYTLHIFDDMVSAFPNSVNNPRAAFDNAEDIVSANAQALNWLIQAMEHGNLRLSETSGINANAILLLKNLGIDTSRSFTINGTAFEVQNGAIQTQGFTPLNNPNKTFLGVEGLKSLVARLESTV